MSKWLYSLITALFCAFCGHSALAAQTEDKSFRPALVGVTPLDFKGFRGSNTLRPFSSDGCSLSPNGIPLVASNIWVDCCIEHDKIYWIGGPKELKDQADLNLRSCIAAKGHAIIANWYYKTVKQFGGPESNKTYRWGYGWQNRRDFSPLEDWEKEQVQTQIQSLKNASQFSFVIKVFEKVGTGYSYEEIQIMKYLKAHIRNNDRIESMKKYIDPSGLVRVYVRITSCQSDIIFTFNKSQTQPGPMLVEGSENCSSLNEDLSDS